MFHGTNGFVEYGQAVPTTIWVEPICSQRGGRVQVSKVGNRVSIRKASLPLGHFFLPTYVVDRPVRRSSQVRHRRTHHVVTFFRGRRCRQRTDTSPAVTSVDTTVVTRSGLDDPHFIFLLVHENFINLPQLFVNTARPVMLVVMSHFFTEFHDLPPRVR
uniref:(northern house mosquito) hypothetical protein n=1 Tax=Culex pipiens TaxID=7175 RepID=A0A8D8AS88_CULPI